MSSTSPDRPRKLYRSDDDSMVAGVCAGLAEYLNVDPTLVRVAAVVLLVIAFPGAVIAYLLLWALMPRR
jgi:phage shock protein PspC (stress-responsive transcriptional regulator)